MQNKIESQEATAMGKLVTRLSVVVIVVALLLGAVRAASSEAKASGGSEADEKAAIVALLNEQTAAWNRGDIEGFMNGYWKSNGTEFVSAQGISHGWQALLERYRHIYPDRKAMGQLTFSKLEIRVECATAAYAVGEFHLQREADNPSGAFTLNFIKFPEGWRIVVDHTTAYPNLPKSAK